MPRTVDANPWILPLVLQQLSENPREPDLVGCRALVLSLIPQTRRMEIFDGAHILQVSLSVVAIEDLDRDEDALGITSKNLIGHIVAVAGLTLVPDLYSSPLGVIATVTKLTPFCDKLQRPVSRPPLVETDAEVRKILSARLGECFSSCVLPSFELNGSGGATGAASICRRSPGAPPQELLRNVSDFNVECGREAGPLGTSGNRDDPAPGRISPPKAAASSERPKPRTVVNIVPKPLPPLQNANFASGAAAAAPPPLMPWAVASFSSGAAATPKSDNMKAANDDDETSHAKITTPSCASRPAASSVVNSGESKKRVPHRSSSDGSSWSNRSPLPIVSMQESEEGDVKRSERLSEAGPQESEEGDVERSERLSEAGPSVRNPSNAVLNGDGAIVKPDVSNVEQVACPSKAPLAQSDSDKPFDAESQVPARQPVAKRVLSAIEAAGAFATGITAPRLGTVSTDSAGNTVRQQRLNDSSPEANSSQAASVVAAEKMRGDTEEDGESTLSIPHDDLMQVEREIEVTQSLRQKKDFSPRRARSGMSAARNAARSAALALAGVRTPLNSCGTKKTEVLQSRVGGSVNGDANPSNRGTPIVAPLVPEVPAGASDTAASGLFTDKRNAKDNVDDDSDSLDDEADETWGSSHLPETQGNLEFAVGTVNLPIGSMESPKYLDEARTTGKKGYESNPISESRVKDLDSGHVEVRREGEEIVEEIVEETGTVGVAPAPDSPLPSQTERQLATVTDRAPNASKGREIGEIGVSLNLERGVPVDSNGGPDIDSAATNHARNGLGRTEKKTNLKEVHDKSRREGGDHHIPRGQSKNVLAVTPDLYSRSPSDWLEGSSRKPAKESAGAMYEEAANIMSRLRSLNRVQSSNPWHACLAPNSSLISPAEYSRNADLLEQSVQKRLRSASALSLRKDDHPSVKRKRTEGSHLSMPGAIFDARVTHENPMNGAVRPPRVSYSDDGDDAAPLKRQRESKHPRKAVDALFHTEGKADLLFLEGSTSCGGDRVVAETPATVDGNFRASVSREKSADPVAASKAANATAQERATREGLHVKSCIPADSVVLSVATKHWNAVKTDWTQEDFTRRMAVRNEAQPGEPTGELSAADLRKLSSCVNAVVAVFNKDLNA